MSGLEWNSSYDDASFAKLNRKTVLADTGSGIEATPLSGAGQVAYCTSTLANGQKEKGMYYSTEHTNTVWIRMFDQLRFPLHYGAFNPYSSTFSNNVEGLFRIATSSGTVALQAEDASLGRCVRFTAASGAGNTSGFNVGQQCMQRQWNPSFHARLRVQETSNNRYFFGFTTTTSVLGNTDDPLNGIGGVLIGRRSGDTNIFYLHNDGVGATNGTDSGIAATTNSMIIHIFADEGQSKWFVSVETPAGFDSRFLTSNIPSSTSSQSIQLTYINNAAGSRSFELFQALASSQR